MKRIKVFVFFSVINLFVIYFRYYLDLVKKKQLLKK